jgi:hypothetical protein
VLHSGTSGTSGTSGVGTSGTSGSSGTSGAGASLTLTDGSNTVANVSQITVTGGTVGGSTPNATLTISGGGGGGISTVYTNVVRYATTSGSDKAQLMSSGTLYGGLSWTRSSTTLTVTSTSHGLTTGDYVLLRNFNVDYVYVSITSTGTDTFTCTVADSGATSGSEGAYIPSFKVTALNETTLTIASPSAGNCQLLSVQVYIDSSETGVITVTLPNDIKNGAGDNTSLSTKNPPVFVAYNVSGAGSAFIGAAGVTFSTTSGFNTYTLSGGLATFGAVLYTFKF